MGLPIPQTLVTSEDVAAGKPAPDGYHLGAKHLGLEPTRCVVFEDAPAGIAAGRAAGAHVVALRTTDPAADFSGAEAVIGDFTAASAVRNRGGYLLTLD